MSTKHGGAVGLVTFIAILSANAATWHSSFETAKQQGRGAGRPILMNFTGSDWCPACAQLRSSVLNTPEFHVFADQRLVLMEVDFPRSRPMAALHRQANEQLARKYGVTAYPTLLLVDANGTNIGQIQPGGTASQLVATLDQFLTQWSGAQKVANAPAPAPARISVPAPVRDLPLFGGAATAPPPVYTNLVVKSISGTTSRRFALINSETMAPGDSAWFKLADRRIRVQCIDVRETSALVRVEGEPGPRELWLASLRP